jgi:hypothetical protein
VAYDLRVWVKPEPGFIYAIGGDPAEGLEHGDDSVLEVFNATTGGQCAELQGKIEPFAFAEIAFMLGTWYNHALIGIEANKDGGANRELLALGYRNIYFEQVDTGQGWDKATPRLGINVNLLSRHRLIAQARRWLEEKVLFIYSRYLIEQMETFVLRDAKYQAIPGGHDDLVMAFVILVDMLRITTMGGAHQDLPALVNGEPVAPAMEDPDLAEKQPRSNRLIALTQTRQLRESPATTMGNIL